MMRRAMPLLVGVAITVSSVMAGPAQASEPSAGPGSTPVVLGPGVPFAEGGRVAFPEGGYAVTFPDDWYALISGTRENEAILEALRTAAPDLVPMLEAFLASGTANILLGVAPATGTFVENCNVVSQPAGGLDTEGATGDAVETLEGIGSVVAGPDEEMVTLPAGRAGRIDLVQRVIAPDGTPLDVAQAIWAVSRDDVLYTLTCTGQEPDADTWNAIAESLEIVAPAT